MVPLSGHAGLGVRVNQALHSTSWTSSADAGAHSSSLNHTASRATTQGQLLSRVTSPSPAGQERGTAAALASPSQAPHCYQRLEEPGIAPDTPRGRYLGHHRPHVVGDHLAWVTASQQHGGGRSAAAREEVTTLGGQRSSAVSLVDLGCASSQARERCA